MSAPKILKHTGKEYLWYDPALTFRPFGLANVGNTCWFNSTLQVLFNMSAVTKFLKSNPVFAEKYPFVKMYLEVVDAALNRTDEKLPPIDPARGRMAAKNLLTFLTARWPNDYNGQQNDDAFYQLFELMGNVINPLAEIRTELQYYCAKCKTATDIRRDSPAIKLVIPAVRDLTAKQLEAFIHSNILPLDNERMCFGCGETGERNTYKTVLKGVSEIIMLTMPIRGPETVRIEYPDTLYIQSTEGRKFVYELCGVTYHQGSSAQGGHYNAQVKHHGQVYTCDDSGITAVPAFSHSVNSRTVMYHIMCVVDADGMVIEGDLDQMVLQAYCLREKKTSEMKDPKYELNSLGRRIARGTCAKCGTKMYKILAASEGPASLVAKSTPKGASKKSKGSKKGGRSASKSSRKSKGSRKGSRKGSKKSRRSRK